MMRDWKRLVPMVAGLALGVCVTTGARAADLKSFEERSSEARWSLSGSLGLLDFEGDASVEDGTTLNVRVGYDWTTWWSVEGGWFITPGLDENFVGHTEYNGDGDADNVHSEISYAEINGGKGGFGSSWASGVWADGLFHFLPFDRVDPYLLAGVGTTWYEEDVIGKTLDLELHTGGGVMYHINDEWAIRADFRSFIRQHNIEASSAIDAGVVWYWGARVPADLSASGDVLDSDRDGLPDDEEKGYGTDPYNPDTDNDGLMDGPEVREYATNPLEPDTDFDGLRDGEEVFTYHTTPTLRDTDGGGVADGHEVIEDKTNPLVGSDDLMLIELYIQFDFDKSDIKAEYNKDLDVIVKMLTRYQNATVRIEGHADQTYKSKSDYNIKLSQRRAKAVLDYIATHGVEAKRMEAVGYGYTRPKEKPDLKNGNPKNRRVEVYIRGVEKAVNAPQPELDTDLIKP